MSEPRKISLLKPTLETPFCVDFDWWQKNDNNWRISLRDMLCPEHQEAMAEMEEDHLIDWIDPQTGEVTELEGLQTLLINHCAKQEGFLDIHTALVEAVFRVLLANGNKPMTPIELGDVLNRPAETILKTLAGMRVYKGIKPYNP